AVAKTQVATQRVLGERVCVQEHVVHANVEGTRGRSGRDHGPPVVGDGEHDALAEHATQALLELLAGPLVDEQMRRRAVRLVAELVPFQVGDAHGRAGELWHDARTRPGTPRG